MRIIRLERDGIELAFGPSLVVPLMAGLIWLVVNGRPRCRWTTLVARAAVIRDRLEIVSAALKLTGPSAK